MILTNSSFVCVSLGLYSFSSPTVVTVKPGAQACKRIRDKPIVPKQGMPVQYSIIACMDYELCGLQASADNTGLDW